MSSIKLNPVTLPFSTFWNIGHPIDTFYIAVSAGVVRVVSQGYRNECNIITPCTIKEAIYFWCAHPMYNASLILSIFNGGHGGCFEKMYGSPFEYNMDSRSGLDSYVLSPFWRKWF